MTKTLTWLLAGAAMTLAASAAAAADPPADAREAARQAAEDAHESARHEARIYRRDGDDVTMAHDGGRAESLSAMLQLRPDQEPALKALLDATRPEHRHEHTDRTDYEAALTTLQKLDETQARLAQQQAEMNRKIAAVRAFYGQLDDRQKKAFDAMPMVMVVGPNIGPIMVPHVMPIVSRDWDEPPTPPKAPTPPKPPGL
ncbi:MAG TPA: Spy/CpxP family protein refolding chaperone [Phenylobacterium sp.]|nr:Spy/CpxP family protein refolding chaperone [Phenylobacterium sp.]